MIIAEVARFSLVSCHRAGDTVLHGCGAFLRENPSRRETFHLSALEAGADFPAYAERLHGFLVFRGCWPYGEAWHWISALSPFAFLPLAVTLGWPRGSHETAVCISRLVAEL
jgi:hypothetical protein